MLLDFIELDETQGILKVIHYVRGLGQFESHAKSWHLHDITLCLVQLMPFMSIALDSYWRVDLIRHQDFKKCSVNVVFMIFRKAGKSCKITTFFHGNLSWYISSINFTFVSLNFYCRVDPNRHQNFENRITDKNFMFIIKSVKIRQNHAFASWSPMAIFWSNQKF